MVGRNGLAALGRVTARPGAVGQCAAVAFWFVGVCLCLVRFGAVLFVMVCSVMAVVEC